MHDTDVIEEMIRNYYCLRDSDRVFINRKAIDVNRREYFIRDVTIHNGVKLTRKTKLIIRTDPKEYRE